MKRLRSSKNHESSITNVSPEDIRIVKRASMEFYECPICTSNFSRKGDLYKHIRRFHPTKMLFYECSHCDNAFISESRKTRHENRMHYGVNTPSEPSPSSNDSNYMTRNHSKSVSARKRRYERRTNSTTDTSLVIPPFIDTPKRRKRKIESLEEHTTDISPAVPSSSSKSISTNTKTHSGAESTKNKNKTKIVYANKLTCSYCNKFCINAKAKARHEKLHTGIRSFKCKSCSGAFFYKITLTKHEAKCRNLHEAVWCQLCDYNTFAGSSMEGHYRRVHDFKFTSDIEKKFLEEEINAKSTSKEKIDVSQDDNDSNESSSIEAEISQSKHNLLELFRDYIVLPNEPSEGSVGQKESECEIEISRSNETVEEIVRSDNSESSNLKPIQNDDAATLNNPPIDSFENNDLQEPELEGSSSTNLQEALRDHNYIFFSNSEPVVDTVPVEETATEAPKEPESSECKIEIPEISDTVEETVRVDDPDQNSTLVDDTDISSPINTPIEFEALNDTEISKGELEIPPTNDKPEIIIQDDILEPNSEHFDDNILRDDNPEEISERDKQPDDIETKEIVEEARNDVQASMPECLGDNTTQEDRVIDTPEENSQLNSDTQNVGDFPLQSPQESCENVPEPSDSNLKLEVDFSLQSPQESCENVPEPSDSNFSLQSQDESRENLPEPSDSNLKLEIGNLSLQTPDESRENIPESSDSSLNFDMEIVPPETTEPVVSAEKVEIVDTVEGKSSEYDSEITQVENNLKEIFGSDDDVSDTSKISNKTDREKPIRTIDLTGNEERVVKNIDLTLSDDEDEPISSKIIVIDDDDDD